MTSSGVEWDMNTTATDLYTSDVGATYIDRFDWLGISGLDGLVSQHGGNTGGIRALEVSSRSDSQYGSPAAIQENRPTILCSTSLHVVECYEHRSSSMSEFNRRYSVPSVTNRG